MESHKSHSSNAGGVGGGGGGRPGQVQVVEEDGDEKAAATCFDKQSVKSQRWNTNLEKTFLVPSLLKSEK